MGALVVGKKRKNIDIPIDTFRNLSIRAAFEGRSLKSFIENLLIMEAKAMSNEELHYFLVKNKPQAEKYLNETERNEVELANYPGEKDKLEYEQLKNAFLNGSKRSMSHYLGTLDFVTSLETASESKLVQLRRQNLIRYPQEYNPMALAGAAEESPLSLSQIRKEWT